MATRFALQIFTLVLFFFTIGQETSARDLKVELGNHKQVDSFRFWSTNQVDSNDRSYIASYADQPGTDEDNQPGPPVIEDLDVVGGPGSGGDTDGEVSQHNYIAGYTPNSEDSKGHSSPIMDRKEAFKRGFFTLNDLYVGNIMTLQFSVQEVSPFLSRKEAESIPFSMSQLPSVLQLFSIPENSPQTKPMRGTLEQCEAKPSTGETKICATSLISMLEFVDKVIGSDTKHNILTTSYPTLAAVALQNYTILKVSHDINAPKWVACHPLPYPYAIYYCHFIAKGSKVFKVSLVGENSGDKMEALGICHLDTSYWSPNHIIFKQLGIKAGKDPLCHFFPVNHLLWIPKPSKATM